MVKTANRELNRIMKKADDQHLLSIGGNSLYNKKREYLEARIEVAFAIQNLLYLMNPAILQDEEVKKDLEALFEYLRKPSNTQSISVHNAMIYKVIERFLP